MSTEPTARRTLRLATVAALQALTGITVESPFDVDIKPAKLPHIGVRAGVDRKAPMASQGANFTTTASVEILVTVQDTTGAAVQDAVEDLGARIEAAIFGAVPLMASVQRVAGCSTSTEVTAEGEQHIARLKIVADFNVAETFDPTLIDPSLLQSLLAIDLHADLANRFDRSGTYGTAPFPSAVAPAPRASGPDGRDEARAELRLDT